MKSVSSKNVKLDQRGGLSEMRQCSGRMSRMDAPQEVQERAEVRVKARRR